MKLAHAGTVQKNIPHAPMNIHSAAGPSGFRLRAGNILLYFLSFLLVGSATAKLLQIPPVVTGMAAVGFYGSKLVLISVLEIVSALLFAFPRTRPLGLLMVSAYLGGAIAAHIGHNDPRVQPAVIVLALCWISAWLRHPEIFPARNEAQGISKQ
jgi:DoxX-like family